MDTKEVAAALVEIDAALVEKLGKQPKSGTSLQARTSGKWAVCLWRADEYEILHQEYCDTAERAIAAARDFVAAMPDPEAAKLTAWHGRLADVIDEGHTLNLPDDVMTPLRQSSQAMTENLLTHAAE